MDSSKNQTFETSWTRLESVLNAEESYTFTESRPRTTISVRKIGRSHRTPLNISTFRCSSASKSAHNRLKRPNTVNIPNNSLEIVSGITLHQIQKIYRAKCEDLEIPVLENQEKRFLNYCLKSFSNRKFQMKESGVSKKTAKIIGEILEFNSNFAYIDLSKNLLKDEGAISLVKRLMKSASVVHLDLSSNEISAEGSETILNLLASHVSLVSLDLSSHEGLHRNRLASLGSQAVAKLLSVNQVLSILNVSGTGIMSEGLEFIIDGLQHNLVLSVLNLSNNNLSGKIIEKFAIVISCANLQELDLSSNKIGNDGCEFLSMMLSGGYKSYCTILKLNLSENEITTFGISKIFAAMRINSQVTHLNLKKNDFSRGLSTNFSQFLEENVALRWLDLSHCQIDCNSLAGIEEGLCKNVGINYLNLSSNFIHDEGSEKISTGLRKNSALKILDLSNNRIHDKGGVCLAKMIQVNECLEELYLKNNSIKEDSGRMFSEFTRYRHNIMKMNLDLNPLSFKYIEIIKANLKANHDFKQKSMIPNLQQIISKIQFKDTALIELNEKIMQKQKERSELEKKIKSKGLKYEDIKNEENLKFDELKNEYLGLREISQKLSNEIEEYFLKIKVTKI